MDGACIFCHKEMGFLKITDRQYNMGIKCYVKSIKKNIIWGRDTKKSELKQLLG